MFGTMFLGVGNTLILAMVDGIKCENRGRDVNLLHVILTLYRSYHLHFSSHLFSTLVSKASIVLDHWQKNSCALKISGIILTGMLALISPFMTVSSTLDKIIMLDLVVFMWNVFVFQSF
jgi:hypothetical protein